jgi:tricorn protease
MTSRKETTMRRLVMAFSCVLFASQLQAQAPKGYYRFPTIHEDTVVFAAEGDLWKVGLEGGTAQRLTSHPGEESHPRFSPNGSTLAFSATYEGPQEMYAMPAVGGLPERLTYEGESAYVRSWTPEGRILYLTRKYSTLPRSQLALMDPQTGQHERIALAQAADGSFSGDGTLYFTRFPRQSSYTKRYKGGTAQDIWKYAPAAEEAVPLTSDYTGTSRSPMWWDGRVYFASDRDGTMNIWSMNPDGGDLRQHTLHDGWDIQSPSVGSGHIVYQLGADLRVYDIGSDEDREIPITLTSDFDQMREKWIKKPMDYLTAVHPSPDADRVVLTARGQVFVAPVKQGRLVEVSRNDGVRYRQARFLPDGENLMALSDESGEVEWWKLLADAIGDPEQITSDGKVLRFGGVPSPDGRWIAYDDHNQELWLLNLEDGQSKKLAFSSQWYFEGYSWSPDSRWLAYSMPADNGVYQILLYSVEDETTTPLTTDRYDSRSPVWSPDGLWIFFLSDRNYQSLVRSPWGSRQPEPYFDKKTKVFHVSLRPGERSPFRHDDELFEKAKDEDSNDDEGPPKVEIALEGIAARLMEVPVAAGNYSQLSVNEDRLFWISTETSFKRTKSLSALSIGNEGDDPEVLVEDVKTYELSLDGKKIVVHKGGSIYVIDASSEAGASLDKAGIDLSAWTFAIDPREEWKQMFVESWRLQRDYFYDPEMHSVDWEAMLGKYLPLVERVTNRGELSDLQAQMASELSALHTYVYGGDHREGEDEIDPASLGAVLLRDEAAGGYRVEHIYDSDPDLPDQLSPLARSDVDVGEGDVIQSINGTPALSVAHPGALLRHQADKQVRLRVKPSSGEDSRDVVVVPITSGREWDLRYDSWEYSRRTLVDSLSNGDIGYVHLRAMGSSDIAQWFREFYPVFNRKGLVIDVRHNGGGNIDSWILGRLLRRAWMYWQPRVGDTYWNMQYAFRGHMCVLVNEWTGSDGEAFAEGFRRLGLGKVLGTRTWGGEIWLTSSNVLVDKGIVTAAEFGVYGPEGVWLIEGHGVDPDIGVDNLPHTTFLGGDSQLRTAVGHLLDLIEKDPRPVPPPPEYPDMSLPGSN